MQKNLASDSRKSNTDNVWRTSLIIKTMDGRIRDLLHAFNKMLLHRTHRCNFFIQIFINHLRSKTNPCNSRYIFRTGTDIFLLFTAKYDWFYLHMFINIKHSDPFRSMDLMSTDGTHIHLQALRVNVILSKPLHGIHMEQNVLVIRFYHAGSLLDWLYGSHLIIHIHHRYKDRVFTECILQCIQTDSSKAVHRKKCNTKSFLFQIAHRINDRRMLNSGCNQMIPCSSIRFCCPDQCQIITFRTSRGEKDFFLLHL